jgi:hypothetical protein
MPSNRPQARSLIVKARRSAKRGASAVMLADGISRVLAAAAMCVASCSALLLKLGKATGRLSIEENDFVESERANLTGRIQHSINRRNFWHVTNDDLVNGGSLCPRNGVGDIGESEAFVIILVLIVINKLTLCNVICKSRNFAVINL